MGRHFLLPLVPPAWAIEPCEPPPGAQPAPMDVGRLHAAAVAANRYPATIALAPTTCVSRLGIFVDASLVPPAIPTMTYDDLVDLWVTWPLLDFQGSFKASVHEDLMAAIAGLAELYHNTPPAERAPASAVVNDLYTFLRTLPLDGVPANLAPDFVPSNPDFIYDLFIRGSE